jgi:NAD(P)-dependent dehydrogenase (short-subunit alcohol dehydrogenase family)
VAVASRSQSDPTDGKALPLKVDVTKEEDIIAAFKQVQKSFGAPPNVVIYNGVLFNYTQIFN